MVGQELKDPNVYKKRGPVIDLLFWVLLKLRDVNIKSVNKECVSNLFIIYKNNDIESYNLLKTFF